MVKALLLIFGLLAITTPQPGTSGTVYEQHITLYEGKGCTGNTTRFDQANEDFSYFTSSFYLAKVNGIGLVYNNPYFNTGSSVIHYPKMSEPVFDYYHTCYRLFQGKGNKVGSVRFAGDLADYRRDTLNLYKEENYEDEVQLLVKDAPNGIKPCKSLIITGKSAWTLYEKPDYKEAIACISAREEALAYEPGLITNIAQTFNFTSIQSVRKGCDEDQSNI